MIDMFMDAWSDGWIGKLIAALMMIVVAFVIWLIFVGVYYAVDSWFVTPQPAVATVVDYEHKAAWTQMVVHNTGKTTWVQPIHHPESWSLIFEIDDGRRDTFGCSEDLWNSVELGRKVNVTFKEGRFSGCAYVVTAEL